MESSRGSREFDERESESSRERVCVSALKNSDSMRSNILLALFEVFFTILDAAT